MNCISCGGKVDFTDGIYVCENCGARQQIEAFLENIDVFICYIEYGEQGRRTKDSIIAQDIYKKLQNDKINAFYQRITAANLIDEDFRKAQHIAIGMAKIVIVCATSKENFIRLLTENKEKLTNKTVIPVYASITAYDIPEEFGKFQAINYDNVGATNDLTKNILQILGRETEVEVRHITTVQMRKKRKRISIVICTVLGVLVLTTSYIVFGSPYVLKSKKYVYAQELVGAGKFIDAATLLSNIINYKDAEDLLNNIYNRYDGYFINEDKTLCLKLNIDRNLKIEIKLIRIINNETVSLTVSSVIKGDRLSFDFIDNQNNSGKGMITLKNDGIILEVNTENSEGFSIGNINCKFTFSNRTDAPITAKMSKDLLLKIIKSSTTESELLKQGYEFEDNNYDTYKVKNNDVKFYMTNMNHKQIGEELIRDPLRAGNSVSITEEKKVYAASAAANIIMPEKIGKYTNAYIVDDIIFVPFAEVRAYGGDFSSPVAPLYDRNEIQTNLSEKTKIFIASKTALGEYFWCKLCENVAEEYNSDILGNHALTMISEDNRNMYMYLKQEYPDFRGYISNDSSGNYQLYVFSKDNFKGKLLKKIEFDNDANKIILNDFIKEYYSSAGGYISRNISSNNEGFDIASSQNGEDYLFNSDKEYITVNYLDTQTREQVRLIVNEMYARHGYIFKLDKYKQYFSSKKWYTPKYTSEQEAESYFNEIERQNKVTIVNYEKSKGWK